jgi:hypothetical protein
MSQRDDTLAAHFLVAGLHGPRDPPQDRPQIRVGQRKADHPTPTSGAPCANAASTSLGRSVPSNAEEFCQFIPCPRRDCVGERLNRTGDAYPPGAVQSISCAIIVVA